jgi:hypothetical protein
MYNNLIFKGATIYGMNTNSLFINKDFKFENSKRDNNTFELIEQTKYETNKEYIYKFYEFKQNGDTIQLVDYPPQKIILMKDKYNDNKYINIFDNYIGLIIKGKIPECGKITCLKKYANNKSRKPEKIKLNNYVNQIYQNILFVSPYNRLCFEFLNDRYNVCTLHQLLSLRVNNMHNDVEIGCKYDISKFDGIVFDEIYCCKSMGNFSQSKTPNYQ